jgi:hypothetical protein
LPSMPTVTIKIDGSINPSNVPIEREENSYTLTGDVTDYNLIIKCSNTTLNGAGFKIQVYSTIDYAPTCRITVHSNGVNRVKPSLWAANLTQQQGTL